MAAEEKRAIVIKILRGKSVGQYRFLHYAKNNRVIGGSHNETYHNKKDIITLHQTNYPGFVVYEKTKDGLVKLGNFEPQGDRAY